jgi:hypothetical protein
MPFPGYNEMQSLRARLPALSPLQRAAFAAASAERVLPLYLYFFNGPSRCVDAVELAWRFAMGDRPDDHDVQEVDDACEAQIGELYDSDDTDYPMYSVKSLLGALHSVKDATEGAALDAAFNAQDAARSADVEHRDPAVLEEATWQLRALDALAASPRISRDMFAPLSGTPNWLQEFRRKNKLTP